MAKKRFGLSEEARVLSCYEAGRDGFWLHRYLAHRGVRNLVVDSSSIEVNRRARRAKTDKLEIGKLLTMLMRYDSGERKLWSVVRASDRSGTRLCGSVGDRAFVGWNADTRGVEEAAYADWDCGTGAEAVPSEVVYGAIKWHHDVIQVIDSIKKHLGSEYEGVALFRRGR